ncbi:hypothetical protein LTR09_009761 [Extremus antarcticus]|uniref:Uncharacterized protein n=1 Tax=Extremus antarcticus TaxID=702011 RepID=A0AAJ0G8X3_9PEZI|nr:hypothetical protein LTR09_009761 [Extremus antarcticus]
MKNNTLLSLAAMLATATAKFSIETFTGPGCPDGEGTLITVELNSCAPTTSAFASFRLADNSLFAVAEAGETIHVFPQTGCDGGWIWQACAYADAVADTGMIWNADKGTCISSDSDEGEPEGWSIQSQIDLENCVEPPTLPPAGSPTPGATATATGI